VRCPNCAQRHFVIGADQGGKWTILCDQAIHRLKATLHGKVARFAGAWLEVVDPQYLLIGFMADAGIIVSLFMTWLTLGKEAMKTLFKRFFLWRVNWKWYLVAILLMPALRFAAIPLTAWLTGIPADYSHPMIRDVVPLDWPLLALLIPWILFEIFTNGEEMGWRGYVLPRLQAKYNALTSTLIIGAIWSVWHLPKFFGTGSSEGRSFFWFTVFTMSVAVLYTWLYNNTHGSLLLVTLFHASGNTFGAFLPAKFAVTGGILSNLETVFVLIAAVVVTMLAGAERLSRAEEMQIQE